MASALINSNLCDVNLKDKDGLTALMHAAKAGRERLVDLLADARGREVETTPLSVQGSKYFYLGRRHREGRQFLVEMITWFVSAQCGPHTHGGPQYPWGTLYLWWAPYPWWTPYPRWTPYQRWTPYPWWTLYALWTPYLFNGTIIMDDPHTCIGAHTNMYPNNQDMSILCLTCFPCQSKEETLLIQKST